MALDKTTQTELIRVAHLLADAARPETLRLFRSAELIADDKGATAFDPVTAADHASEQVMRNILARERPDDSVLGEEFGSHEGTSGLTWVLDPIDGTRGYISGTPTWGVLISVADATGPRFGLIDQPYIGERFAGGFGTAQVVGPHGTMPLRARHGSTLQNATVLSTFPEIGTPLEMRAFQAVSARARLTRYGMDCYGYALLAAGQVDLVIEAGLNAYDIHAPIAVIEAAGGMVTDWTGAPAHHGGRVIAAANPTVHAAALAILQGVVNA
ncbi:inositol monophosphatase family protein [Yoonia sp.]|uniref:inositol monophosphatase family protein n=1 Tax=Yoonia sp. TaxID=2212373 RepID=UPI0025EE0277|nr:inositol monophosphatase family protein [Yoonia sp.]